MPAVREVLIWVEDPTLPLGWVKHYVFAKDYSCDEAGVNVNSISDSTLISFHIPWARVIRVERHA